MNFEGMIILVAFFISGMVLLPGEGCVKLYRHCDYAGFSRQYCNRNVAWIGNYYNDEFSSFKLGLNTTVVLF